MDIQRFRHFCATRFQVEERAEHLPDGRSRPQIGVKTIFRALVSMGVLGVGSLLGLEGVVRTSKGKKVFGCSYPLVSDSTLSRSLWGVGLAGLQAFLEAVDAAGRRIGESRCEVTQGRLRVGAIAGSTFGRFSASCFAQSGAVCLMGGLEPIPKRGKELPASTRLVRRLSERFGPRWSALLLLDGLYVAQGFLRVCLNEGRVDVLIKTQEEGLNILQDAMGLFGHPKYAQDLEHIQGPDLPRLRAYEVYALGGFFLEGVETPFKVAWVREEVLHPGQVLEFWGLTSLQDLTAGEMRELAHWRWDIENNGFKMLNALVHPKHLYAHAPHAAQAVLLILFLAGNLLQLFLAQIPPEEIEASFGKVKATRRFLQGELFDSIADLPLPDTCRRPRRVFGGPLSPPLKSPTP